MRWFNLWQIYLTEKQEVIFWFYFSKKRKNKTLFCLWWLSCASRLWWCATMALERDGKEKLSTQVSASNLGMHLGTARPGAARSLASPHPHSHMSFVPTRMPLRSTGLSSNLPLKAAGHRARMQDLPRGRLRADGANSTLSGVSAVRQCELML